MFGLTRGRNWNATVVPPAPPRAADALPGELTGQLVELVSVPIAVVDRVDGCFAVTAANRLFRQTGLGGGTIGAALVDLIGDRLDVFLQGATTTAAFDLPVGDAVDARHFRVTLSRRPDTLHVDRCIVTLVDHTPAQRTEASLRRQMALDSLTGLPNRAGFEDAIDCVVTPEQRLNCAVMILNLDRFSRVNACMGSLAGDELLISVARRLKGALRGHDMLARIGGDEFGILVHGDAGAGDALLVARRIEAALDAPFRLSDFEIRVRCSIGIALGSGEIVETSDLIRHAQFAVKRAKSNARIEVYNHSAFDIVRTQFKIETELRRAIENGDLHLAFQPICDLSTGQVSSFESLARWQINGRDISPQQFIPVAEECGLIVPLGRWAMDQAVRTVAEWDERGGGDCGVSIAVNLSAIQLQHDRIAPMVRDALGRHGVAPHRITLELTESALIADQDRIAATLQALKALGASIALDDFGTGYSNLGYLQKLPIDILKVDRSFVTGMLDDPDKVAIVRAVISLAQALAMRTTAEGIETRELAQTLFALGCSHGQGYLYSRPVDREAAFALLSSRNA